MLKVNDLTYQYSEASKTVFEHLNFEIKKGEVLGILGASGSGKTTLQQVLSQDLKNFQGDVLVYGIPLDKSEPPNPNRIGKNFALPNYQPDETAEHNLNRIASRYSNEKTLNFTALFEAVDLGAAMHLNVIDFSKEMIKRLDFILAIMHNPDIILLDDPLIGLDAFNKRRLIELILLLKKGGKTILITTHNIAIADTICDQIAFLVNQKLQVLDDPQTLKLNYGQDRVQVELADGAKKDFSIKRIGDNIGFINFIEKQKVKRITTLEASLEDVFITVARNGRLNNT